MYSFDSLEETKFVFTSKHHLCVHLSNTLLCKFWCALYLSSVFPSLVILFLFTELASGVRKNPNHRNPAQDLVHCQGYNVGSTR